MGAIKVLLVDDEVDFTQTMAFWLKSKGYVVVAVHDGESAVRVIKEEPPDIVFLDLRMPIMDGLECLKRIRKFNLQLPVIIISAYVDDRKVSEMKPLGISGVFYKGADFTETLPLLEAALRTHKQLKR